MEKPRRSDQNTGRAGATPAGPCAQKMEPNEDCETATRKHIACVGNILLLKYSQKQRGGVPDRRHRSQDGDRKRLSNQRGNMGPGKQNIARPYCRKAHIALNRLLIRMGLSPLGKKTGTSTHARRYNKEDPRTPERGKQAEILLRTKGVAEVRLRLKEYPYGYQEMT